MADMTAEMEALRSEAFNLKLIEVEEEVRSYGNAAAVTGHTMIRGTYRGQDISGTVRFPHVYA